MTLSESVLSLVTEETSMGIYHVLEDLLSIPSLYGGISIDMEAEKYPALSTRSIVFPNKDHRLLLSRKGNRKMSSFDKVIDETVKWIESEKLINESTNVFNQLWNKILNYFK